MHSSLLFSLLQLVRMKMTPGVTLKEKHKLKMTAACIPELYQSVLVCEQETNVSMVCAIVEYWVNLF